MDYLEQLENQLNQLRSKNLLRNCTCIDSTQGPTIRMADGSEKVLLCSNNYLNLANNPQIKQAVIEAIEQYGTGAAASRLISGTMTPHVELETAFAGFLHKEAALYLPSGWCANQALLTTLPKKRRFGTHRPIRPRLHHRRGEGIRSGLSHLSSKSPRTP